jgi:hypothetical protein
MLGRFGDTSGAMPRRCTVCDHPDREKIDAVLAVRSGAIRKIADEYRLAISSVRRHRHAHLPKALEAVSRDIEAHRGDRIIDSVHWLEREARRLAKKAEDQDDLRTALAGLGQVSKAIELRAKIAGEIQDGNKLGVVIVLPPEDNS